MSLYALSIGAFLFHIVFPARGKVPLTPQYREYLKWYFKHET